MRHLEYQDDGQMEGPFDFDADVIEQLNDDLFGVYLLTHESTDGKILVVYVGRGNIQNRLGAHFDEGEKEALHFFVKHLNTDDDAFREECRLFHLYGKSLNLYNLNHPAVPAGKPRNYPRCTERGCRGEPD